LAALALTVEGEGMHTLKLLPWIVVVVRISVKMPWFLQPVWLLRDAGPQHGP
jgi:hypothetical protein